MLVEVIVFWKSISLVDASRLRLALCQCEAGASLVV